MMVVASSQSVLEKPRIISEVKKTKKKIQSNGNGTLVGDSKPRLCGQLAYGPGLQPRQVEVRDGSLVVWAANRARPELRLALRHLNLQPGTEARTFSLSSDRGAPLASFQASNEGDYERWVKTLAVELMRQTPLEAIRFLDILGITATLSPGPPHCGRRRSEQITGAVKRGLSEDSALRGERGRHRVAVASPATRLSESDTDTEEDQVAALLSRCQQADRFVSVREKRLLFEALCRRGRRLAHSTDNLCGGAERGRRPKRARSLHDLSRGSSVAVREICRYFEQRGRQEQLPPPTPPATPKESVGVSVGNAYLSRRRLQRGERRLARLKQLAADSEEAIWGLQEEMAAIDAERDTTRGSSQRSRGLYATLERRLSEEEARLSRLQEEASKVLKDIEAAATKFEMSLMQSSEVDKTID